MKNVTGKRGSGGTPRGHLGKPPFWRRTNLDHIQDQLLHYFKRKNRGKELDRKQSVLSNVTLQESTVLEICHAYSIRHKSW